MPSLRDRAHLTEWFGHRLPQCRVGVESVDVVSVERISRGVSRETWIVDATVIEGGASSAEAFIIRRDPPDGSVIPVPLRREFDVYKFLSPAEVPVAEALWFEDDARWQLDDRPAYVRCKVDGHWRLPFLDSDDPRDDGARVAASKEHLDKLAAVHTVDWRSAGFGQLFTVPPSPAACATTLLDDIEHLLAEFQFEPSPAVTESLVRLRDIAPDDAPCVALCKGTNGHGEEVWSHGRIVAMSDWELARLGDPAYDFAQLQDMVPEIVRAGKRVWGWPEALAYYTDRSGIVISRQRLDFYRACYGLIQFLYAQHSAAAVRRGATDIRLVWAATEVLYRSQLKLGAALGFPARK